MNTYTIEVSMLGYEDHDSRQIIPYTDDLYAKVLLLLLCLVKHDTSQVGRNITRAFWDYYKIVAVIPLEVGGSRNYNYIFNSNREQNLLSLCLFFRIRQTMNAGSQSLRGTCLAGQSRRR